MRAGRVAFLTVLALLGGVASSYAQTELSTADRLDQRRYVAAGDRAYVMGFQDGSFQAQGWHVTGEMGGVWSQPLKLIDGLWFGVDGEWVGPARKFTSGWGYVRMDLPQTAGLRLSRTDFAPDGRRAAVIGLHLANPGGERTAEVMVDVRSEVMSHYPWGWTTPGAGEFNLPDTAALTGGALEFRDTGTSHPNAGAHDWAAVVGSPDTPVGGDVGPDHWGAQAPAEICTGEQQFSCDDGPYGKGAGGQLRYAVTVPAGGQRTLWIAVAGSDRGVAAAREELARVTADPEGLLAAKRAERARWAGWTRLSLPGDPRLREGIEWGKQNLLDSTQRATDLQVRDVNEGKDYPPPAGTVAHARWLGAGYADYPWLFATDGEYTGFAAVTVGQFEAIMDHARALRDVSLLLNGDSGKVVHEVVADGSVYFGTLKHAGNTDETAKFPSLVALLWRWTGDDRFRDEMYDFAVSNLRYIFRELDADQDGWPEGLGNVERTGMGEEKLDNTVYTIRGLYDLADLADSKGDRVTRRWATDHARDLERRFEGAWWMPDFRQYADSLDDPGNVKKQQRHWIGVTPMEVELTDSQRARPGLGVFANGTAALAERESSCYSGEPPYNRGLFHTGCGGGPEGRGERTIFSLNTSIQAVGEGNYGRLGPDQQKRYTDANVEPMFAQPYTGGTPDEQPGAMPEILPSPDFDPAGPRDANIERCTRCRAMVMQAWGNYGTMWPVVHQQLGVRPDMGRGRLEVVPQLPPRSSPIAGQNIRLGGGALKLVAASRTGNRYRTVVHTGSAGVRRLLIGHTLPRGTERFTAYLDGHRRRWAQRRLTNRGLEVTLTTKPGRHVLEIVAWR
jgi:hypothetical protein